jgi:hypothetical protein
LGERLSSGSDEIIRVNRLFRGIEEVIEDILKKYRSGNSDINCGMYRG